MIKILLTLTLIISGYSGVNQSQLLQTQPAIAQTKQDATTEARVLSVEATGEANNYTFAVTVDSPDTGCDRYADWWEVISPEGELLYRRVLLHSHVDEQPFQRTGGIVAIEPQQEVIIRVHMSSDGYSSMAQQGTVESGFTEVTLPAQFAANLESVEPLADNCAF